MTQLILPIEFDHCEYNPFDFVVTYSNLEGYKAITTNNPWPHGRLLIIGEEGSGKTHLATIWKHLHASVTIHSLDDYHKCNRSTHFVFDNIEFADEKEMCNILNLAAENKQQLLMTCGHYGEIYLPDLKSRLQSTYKILLKGPDENLTKILISKTLHDLQIKIHDDTLSYAATRIHRSFKNIREFCYTLNHISIQQKKPPSIQLAKKALAMVQEL